MKPVYKSLTVLDIVPFGLSGTRFFALRLSNPGWEAWNPGQFVMLRPRSFGQELPWGRAFSICLVTDSHLVCFIKVDGPGTKKISQLRGGDVIDAWGPLGNYFAMETTAPTLLLAGGMGIAPFVGYVNRHPNPWNVSMLFGHRDPLGCYPADSINERILMDSLQENEDGDLDNLIYSMEEKMRDCAAQNGLVLACGPLPFLKTVQRIALELSCRCQLSLENKMACGVGACLGCVCRTTEKWPVPQKREWPVPVCAHGPIFWADQISLDNDGKTNQGGAL